jgi:zinc protease
VTSPSRALALVFALSLGAACSGSTVVDSPAPEPTPSPTAAAGSEPAAVTLVAERTDSAMVAIRVVFASGSGDDLPGQEGATALAADLMVEGGAGGLSYAELTERLFPMAATLRVQTSRDQTVFVGRVRRRCQRNRVG